MDKKETEKTQIAVSKSFLSVGPTLHYSHKNVQRCWILAVIAFGLSCLFWSKIVTGSFWSFNFKNLVDLKFWRLGDLITTGVSIFEYPWQILVLGLLMGIMAIVPILISQLMSFRHSIPFILAVFFLAGLPGFTICLLISCFAAACRPLRFRSRFIAIALCATPQVLYWGFLGGADATEPIEWGFSFAPWICAWIDGLIIAGFVLGIGHFTRYRPGLIWIFTTITLVISVAVFEGRIGFDELDYQLYVAKNDPDNISEFRDHNITALLDRTLSDPNEKEHMDKNNFPSDPIARRAALKFEIQNELINDGWPKWIDVPEELEFQNKRKSLLEQYELFTSKRPYSNRMPIALYYKAILNEYSPDINIFWQREILHFYYDYPQDRASQIWRTLYRDFRNSPESLEARWRIAKQLAGMSLFEQAEEILAEAKILSETKRQQLLQVEQTPSDTLLGLFHPPTNTTITIPKFNELQRKLAYLSVLISSENRTDEQESKDRLAKFVMFNPHLPEYTNQLAELYQQTIDGDRLRDNILLAQAKLIINEQLRAEKFQQLNEEYQNTDGGMVALYELGLLSRRRWSQQDDSSIEQKKKYLAEARETMESFLSLYPDSFYTEQVKEILNGLPVD